MLYGIDIRHMSLVQDDASQAIPHLARPSPAVCAYLPAAWGDRVALPPGAYHLYTAMPKRKALLCIADVPQHQFLLYLINTRA